jgi:hypothetical protein
MMLNPPCFVDDRGEMLFHYAIAVILLKEKYLTLNSIGTAAKG